MHAYQASWELANALEEFKVVKTVIARNMIEVADLYPHAEEIKLVVRNVEIIDTEK